VKQVEDVGSGAKERPGREGLLKAARRREVDVVVSRDVEMAFLEAVGIGTQTVDAEGFATPVSGITSPGQ